MRFSCRTKAWYLVCTRVNVFGVFNFGANDGALGSGTATVGAKLMPYRRPC